MQNPKAWDIARKFGRQMIRMMITDAHNRVTKYERNITEYRNACRLNVNEEHFDQLGKAIQRRIYNTRQKKEMSLRTKWNTLSKQSTLPVNDGWVKNLSERGLTDAERGVLIKGLNFNIRDAPKRQYLASLENALRSNGIPYATQQEIRQAIIPNITRKETFNALSKQETEALEGLKSNKDIIILPADKGRMTVVLDKPVYIRESQTVVERYKHVSEDRE